MLHKSVSFTAIPAARQSPARPSTNLSLFSHSFIYIHSSISAHVIAEVLCTTTIVCRCEKAVNYECDVMVI